MEDTQLDKMKHAPHYGAHRLGNWYYLYRYTVTNQYGQYGKGVALKDTEQGGLLVASQSERVIDTLASELQAQAKAFFAAKRQAEKGNGNV